MHLAAMCLLSVSEICLIGFILGKTLEVLFSFRSKHVLYKSSCRLSGIGSDCWARYDVRTEYHICITLDHRSTILVNMQIHAIIFPKLSSAPSLYTRTCWVLHSLLSWNSSGYSPWFQSYCIQSWCSATNFLVSSKFHFSSKHTVCLGKKNKHYWNM